MKPSNDTAGAPAPVRAVYIEECRAERCRVCGVRTDSQVLVDHSPQWVEWNGSLSYAVGRYCSTRCARTEHHDPYSTERFDALDERQQRIAQQVAAERREAAERLAAANRRAVVQMLPWHPSSADWQRRREEECEARERAR